MPNGVPYEEEMTIIPTSAVVFLTIFLLVWGLSPEHFIEKIKPAMLAFRISQIMLSVLVIIPEKEKHTSLEHQVETSVHPAPKAWEKVERS